MRVNELDLYVELDGTGAPLLVLHGFTGSLATWDALRAELRTHAQLVLVDLIGHGASQSPCAAERYSIERCIEDLGSMLDQLGITHTDVLGYSMGGRVALHFAVAQPQRVRRLVLESASPGIADPEERAARAAADDKLADRVEREGVAAFVNAWEGQPLLALAAHVPAATRDRQHQLRLANSAHGLANSLRGMGTGRQASLWERLPDLVCPTLLLAGEHDRRYVGIAERMLEHLPRAEMAPIADAGHTAHIDQPVVFAQLVRTFLA